jgi:hypothetical protein
MKHQNNRLREDAATVKKVAVRLRSFHFIGRELIAGLEQCNHAINRGYQSERGRGVLLDAGALTAAMSWAVSQETIPLAASCS